MRSDDDRAATAQRVTARLELLPLRVACFIGLADSLVAWTTALVSRPQAASIGFGLAWIAAWAAALATVPRWSAPASRLPWLLAALGALALTPALLDGGHPGNLATQPVWLVVVIACIASWRVTLAAGAVLCAAKLAVFFATGTTLVELSPWHGERSEVTTAAIAPLAIALLSPVLVAALRRVTGTLAAPAAPVQTAPAVVLSPAEQAVVGLLAEGLTPKQIAHARGTSIETVRTQIKRAKRAVQARTLDELVALAWRPR